MGSYFELPLLLEVAEVSHTELQLNITGGYWDEDGTPFYSGGTIHPATEVIFAESPFFSAHFPSIPLSFDGFLFDIQSVNLEGTFSPDGTSIGGTTLEGLIQTASLAPLLEIGAGDHVFCEYISVFGVSCVDCEDGTDTCMPIKVFVDADYIWDFSL